MHGRQQVTLATSQGRLVTVTCRAHPPPQPFGVVCFWTDTEALKAPEGLGRLAAST